MKQHSILFFSLTIFCTSLIHGSPSTTQAPLVPPPAQAVPYYSIRPQGVDAARELAGWTRQVNQSDKECVYTSLSLTAEYARSFNGIDIANSLFSPNISLDGNCGIANLGISGEQAIITLGGTNRSFGDLMAENFYLATDYLSNIQFEPVVENLVVDLDAYVGLENFAHGLFFRLNVPINWTRWTLNFDEVITETGVNDYDPGYFNSWETAPNPATGYEGVGIPRSQLLNSFTDYISGTQPFGVTGATLNPLCFATIQGCSNDLVATRLADITAILGWNFLNRKKYHLGVGILARAPTGNRPTAVYLFEPISGNGGHWELGGHLTYHYMLWQCDEAQSSFGFYLDANITHLFNARQTRTFDLIGKPLSRYMLAEQLGTPVVNLTNAAGVMPPAQFQQVFTPVANLTTRNVKVSVAVQADIAAQFTYAAGDGFTLDFGYNFWGRSCDKISCDYCVTNTLFSVPLCPNSSACSKVAFAPNSWALKGDAYVVGFDPSTTPLPTPVALSATQSQATIYAGTDVPATGDLNNPTQGQSNSAIDNPMLAFNDASGTPAPLWGDPLGLNSQISSSFPPIFIRNCDIDFAGTRGLSNKVYAHMSYTWLDCTCAIPFIGLGGFGEFGMNDGTCNARCPKQSCCKNNCINSCSTTSCNTASLSQWGAWMKIGVSF